MNKAVIWKYLKSQGMTDAGVAGLMGNLYAESGLNPKNLQNTYEKCLGYSDEAYTIAVDNGMYKDFIKDQAGYGLCQWTLDSQTGASCVLQGCGNIYRRPSYSAWFSHERAVRELSERSCHAYEYGIRS